MKTMWMTNNMLNYNQGDLFKGHNEQVNSRDATSTHETITHNNTNTNTNTINRNLSVALC